MPPAKRKPPPRSGPRTKAAPDACSRCGKPAKKLAFGPWRFCGARCRAAFLNARSRKARTAGKKLKCPLCGKGNPAAARRCAHCKERLLWHERSPVWLAIVWTFRAWLLLSLAGIGYVVWQFRDVGSALGGGTDPGALVSLLGQGGGDPEALLDRASASFATKPKAPGPGTWLLPGAGMPPLIMAENPVAGTLFPPNFGTMTPAEKGKAMFGLISSGKIKLLLKPTQIRVVTAGEGFSEVETLANPPQRGWALDQQIVSN